MLDCDGDDIPDPVCSDINEQFGVIQSSAECVDSWPNGECLGPQHQREDIEKSLG